MLSSNSRNMAAFVNAFQFSIGLLLISVTSVASLFEERVNGSLDVLMATPLSTASIVWGKWLAGCRIVVAVTLLPTLLALGMCLVQGVQSLSSLVLLVPLMLSYGALVNSLGLALATCIPRFGVALGVTVLIYVLLAAGPVVLLLASGAHSDTAFGLGCLSPWYGVGETTFLMTQDSHIGTTPWKIFWLIVYAAAAVAIALLTQGLFNRALGRAEEWSVGRKNRGVRRGEQP
jgi:ABC-type transport system involved in multi-copper enzyme maturation permease subunit